MRHISSEGREPPIADQASTRLETDGDGTVTRPALDPSIAKRFRSGRPSVDFAHTAGAAEWIEPELIDDRKSLARWLSHILRLPDVQAAPTDVRAAYQLRAAVLELARARAHNSELPSDAVVTVNQFSAAAPPVPRLTGLGEATFVAPTLASAALSLIARDAIDLLSGPLGHRIRICAAQNCQLLFVDASRPGTRRWCSMQRCGNRAKLRTYRMDQA